MVSHQDHGVFPVLTNLWDSSAARHAEFVSQKNGAPEYQSTHHRQVISGHIGLLLHDHVCFVP
jgi:hypothetical protein